MLTSTYYEQYILLNSYSLMSDSEDFPSDNEYEPSPSPPQPNVSVLKHLPAPLRLLPPNTHSYELYSPRCLYPHTLPTPGYSAMPTIGNLAKKSMLNRLLALEDTFFERTVIRDRVQGQEVETSEKKTLWENFKDANVDYSRFGTAPSKQNFGGVFLSVGGVSLEKKKCSLPLLKAGAKSNTVGDLIFDSHIESGNLMWAFRNSKGEDDIPTYSLVLQNDTNTRGHNQWFHFKATSTRKHQKVRFQIVNLIKDQSLFSYGLKPLVFSQKESPKGLQWHRGGHKINYTQNNIINEHSGKTYSTLSFEYEFGDVFQPVLFAPSYPYTYSQLLRFMHDLLKNSAYQPFLSIKKICETPAKNTINLISISTGKKSIQDTKVIWILARQHPVETTSSFMVEGIVSYLLKSISEAKGQEAAFFDNFTFKIVPMVNPDGVIHGNSRAQATGIDPNRAWKRPSKTTTPGVYHIKKLILQTKNENTLVLDLHSHSKKLGCFFYGNHVTGQTAHHRLLPSVVCENDPRFSYSNCRFRGGNENSARRVLFDELKLPRVYTVECSLLGFVKDNRVCQYDISDYQQMGTKILSVFFDLERQQAFESVESYPHQLNDFCDAQSARSDSCASLYEFPEVYKCLRGKRKIQEKKKKPLKYSSQAQTQHRSLKYEMVKQPYKSLVKEVLRSQTTIKDCHISLERPLVTQNQIPCEEAPSLKTKYNSRQIRLLARKKPPRALIPDSTVQKGSFGSKSFNEQSIQVNQLQTLNGNSLPRTKNRKLMVLGSGVQEQRVILSKNQVGIQANIFKENSINPQQNLSSNKLLGKQGKLEEGQPLRMAKLFRV